MYVCIFVCLYSPSTNRRCVCIINNSNSLRRDKSLVFTSCLFLCMYVSMGAGTGPVDAAYKAIGELTSEGSSEIKLLEYTVSSVTAGIDALGEVTVRLQDLTNNRTGVGRLGHSGCMYKLYLIYMCEHTFLHA